MSKLKNYLKQYPLLILFAVFLLVVGVVDMIVSNRTFSEMENRYLAKRPPLTFTSLVSKQEDRKFSNLYEKYINDQFVGRDTWINLKSVSESALGKIENNGIVYGKNNQLFTKRMTVDNWRFEKNTGFLTEFLTMYAGKSPITIGIIPNSDGVYGDLMPVGYHPVDQKVYIEKLYGSLPETAAKLNLLPALASDKQSYIYYRTDHHWTTRGAFDAYRALADSKGLKAATFESLESLARDVSDYYGSYYNKCKLLSAKPDTITWYEIPFTSITIDGEEKPTLNNNEKWAAHDKHAAFLWDNNGMTVIKSENNLNRVPDKTSRVLLIKDSFGNCFAPFLTYSYDEVYVADLRHLKEKMSELMNRMEFDDILVLYSFENFSSDTNLANLTY